MENTNYINAEIYIQEGDINKQIRIINSYENAKIENEWMDEENYSIYENETQIMKCKIKINGQSIPFRYYFKFKQKGKYNIKYAFPKKLKNINCLFYDCKYITNIDLSNFNTQNAINMTYMFCGCNSLKNINFSNCNTFKVINMSFIFYGCNSLTNIDLSNFNTKNVTTMSFMFYGCNSLTNIDF